MQAPQGYGAPPLQPGYNPPPPLPPQKRTSGCLVALGIIGGLALIVGAGLCVGISSTKTTSTGAASGPAVDLLGKLRSPQVVVDEEVAIGAGGSQMRGFTLPGERPIQVLAEGKSNADKGFTVYVMDATNYEAFAKKAPFRHVPSFEGLKVRSFTHSEALPPGSWCVVVQNSENIFNTMVVHLRIVSDPG
jgi:hypothetical protein